jgi:hypothetical protein
MAASAPGAGDHKDKDAGFFSPHKFIGGPRPPGSWSSAGEGRFLRRALDRWRRNPNLELLGNLEAARLPIVSFRVRHGDRHLHHELVVAMLNDLFGRRPGGRGRPARRPRAPAARRLPVRPHSGRWRHRLAPPDPVPPLSELLDGRAGPDPRPGAGEDALAGYIRQVRALLGAAGPFTLLAGPSWLPPELERLRDFHLPGDAAS